MLPNFSTQDPNLQKDITWLQAIKVTWRRLRRYPFALVAVVLLAIGVALSEGLSVGLVLPFLESIRGEQTSSVLSNTPVGALTPYFASMSTEAKIRAIAVALLIFQGARSIMTYLHLRLGLWLQTKIDMDLRAAVFDQLLRVGLGFIHKEKLGHLFTVLNNYTGNSAAVALNLVNMVPPVVILALYVGLLLSISWQLTLLAIAMAGVTAGLMGRVIRLLRHRGRLFNQAAVRLNHLGFESLSAMRVLRLFAREDYARERFAEGLDDFRHQTYARGSLQSLVSPLFTVSNVLVLALLLIAATLVLERDDQVWVELTVIFMVVLFRLMGPTSVLNNSRAVITSLLPALQSMLEFLQRQDKQFLPEGQTEFAGLKEAIRIHGVSMRYSPTEPDVLSDVSFDIPKGKLTAIVGASGSGKSTLVSLLARLYDPVSGGISADGADLRDFKSSTWRRRVGVVSQDTFLFNDTIRTNIRFGRLDATDEEVVAAAEEANAHGFITGMQEGYDTIVGDRGVRLSGGEAQRVAIARAILADADLLILDEATSSLDTEAERLVQEAIDQVTEQRTVLAIAHRLSTIRDADNIVVLEDGRVVEQGTHNELVARRRRYWHYVQLQDLETGGRSRVDGHRDFSAEREGPVERPQEAPHEERAQTP